MKSYTDATEPAADFLCTWSFLRNAVGNTQAHEYEASDVPAPPVKLAVRHMFVLLVLLKATLPKALLMPTFGVAMQA